MIFEIMMSLLCLLYDANMQYIPAHQINSREIKKTYPNLVENWFSESLAEFIQLGVNSMWIVFIHDARHNAGKLPGNATCANSHSVGLTK